MTIRTAGDLINQALKRSGAIGAGQTAEAEMITSGLDSLNQLIAIWNRKRWLLWSLLDISCVSTGATSYTVGTDPSNDFVTPRFDALEAAYVRLLPVNNNQPYDTPLTIIEAHEDYASLRLKEMTSFPVDIFYDSSFPVPLLYPVPVPQAERYEIHIVVTNAISGFASITTPINLPPAYSDALSWTLSARMRPEYGFGPDPSVTAFAKIALNAIRQANVQVPVMSMPDSYPVRGRGGHYWMSGLIR